ncbi:SCO1 protein [bacterium HR40]|nr:SCO1 protein [bacterium HR40]
MRRSVLAVLWLLVLIAILAALGSWWFLARPSGEGEPAGREERGEVGGPFQLTDHTGRRVSDAEFRGRWLLLFFGYTSCPDVCPTALGTAAVAMEELGPLAERLQPMFVTLDPERDTPDVLAAYVAQFHPAILGLTGTPDEIASVAKAYRVFYRKAVPEGGKESDYLLDHSAYLYLVDPEGKFVRVFTHTQSAEDIAQAIRAAMGEATSG